jgi:hypothetical protein
METKMNRSILCLATISLIAGCGGPPPGGGSDAGARHDSGSPAPDAGDSADAGQQTVTICDLHASFVFAACGGCHGNGLGGFTINLSTPRALYDSLQTTGASRNTLVTASDPSASWLWVRMNDEQGAGPMPPNNSGGKLPDTQIAPVRAWIAAGASDDCL